LNWNINKDFLQPNRRVKEFEDVLAGPQDVIDLKELRKLAFNGRI